jgi:hypothetical protein
VVTGIVTGQVEKDKVFGWRCMWSARVGPDAGLKWTAAGILAFANGKMGRCGNVFALQELRNAFGTLSYAMSSTYCAILTHPHHF